VASKSCRQILSRLEWWLEEKKWGSCKSFGSDPNRERDIRTRGFHDKVPYCGRAKLTEEEKRRDVMRIPTYSPSLKRIEARY
jgi:hypothetical protein